MSKVNTIVYGKRYETLNSNEFIRNGWGSGSHIEKDLKVIDNIIREKKYGSKLKTPLEQKHNIKVIDIGAGTGMLGDLIRIHSDYIGIDVRDEAITEMVNKGLSAIKMDIAHEGEEGFKEIFNPKQNNISVFSGIFNNNGFDINDIIYIINNISKYCETIMIRNIDKKLCDTFSSELFYLSSEDVDYVIEEIEHLSGYLYSRESIPLIESRHSLHICHRSSL